MSLVTMLELATKIEHKSHTDLDGVSCHLMTKLAYPNKEVNCDKISNKDVESTIKDFVTNHWEKDTLLLITDLSISMELAELINTKWLEGYHVWLIDHHEKALPLNKYIWAEVNVTQEVKFHYSIRLPFPFDGPRTYDPCLSSATSLYAEYLDIPHVYKHYAELVRLYDTWDWSRIPAEDQGELAKQLNDYFYMVSNEEFSELFFNQPDINYHYDPRFQFPEDVMHLLKTEKQRIEAYCRKKQKQQKITTVSIEGTPFTVSITSAENYQSELGNYLCEQNEDIDFAVMVDLGKGVLSFRTVKEDVNVNRIAQVFGGGGHPKSSGCTISTKTLVPFILPLLPVEGVKLELDFTTLLAENL